MPRALEWYTTLLGSQSVVNGGQANSSLLDNLPAGLIKGSTITRIIMRLVIRPNVVNTLCFLSFGIVLMTDEAVSASGFPDADVAADQADWIMRSRESASLVNLNDNSQWSRVAFDLRAQRVIRSANDTLQFIIDQHTSGITCTYDLFTRVLVRHP